MTQPGNRPMALFLAVVSLMWLGVAVWTITKGDPVEAVAHCLVATLAVLAALLIGNPDRPRETQRRIFIAAMTLVPITLAIYVASIFL